MRLLPLLLTFLLLFFTPNGGVKGEEKRLRVEVTPRMAIAPDQMTIRVYLTGEERVIIASLYEGEVLCRRSSQDLFGEKLLNILWRQPPTGDLFLEVVTFSKDLKPMDRRIVDLHYIPVIGS